MPSLRRIASRSFCVLEFMQKSLSRVHNLWFTERHYMQLQCMEQHMLQSNYCHIYGLQQCKTLLDIKQASNIDELLKVLSSMSNMTPPKSGVSSAKEGYLGLKKGGIKDPLKNGVQIMSQLNIYSNQESEHQKLKIVQISNKDL